MKITQLYGIVNSVTKEILGETAVVQEDLSNVVDLGKSIIDTENGIDNYVRKLVNHIGKVVFVNRAYAGGVPSVLMDSWEYGSILEKISTVMPEATENESWSLRDGAEYKQDIFHQPKVEAKFFNSKITFEIPMSFTERQVKESFSSAEQLNGFVSMLTTSVENSMTVKLDSLIMRAINNMIAETFISALGAGEAGSRVVDFAGTSVRAINLLKLFNETTGSKLTLNQALSTQGFIQLAVYQLGLVADRMTKVSTLFNSDGKQRFTAPDVRKVVLLSDFSQAATTFLQSDMTNPEMVALPAHDRVPYWQGSGEDYALNSVGAINVKLATGEVVDTTGKASILGVVFDRDAVGVANLDRRVTTNYNAKAEFFNNYYKMDAGYYNDTSENFVVFYMA